MHYLLTDTATHSCAALAGLEYPASRVDMALLTFLGVPPPKQKRMPTEQDQKSTSERISAIFGKQYAKKN